MEKVPRQLLAQAKMIKNGGYRHGCPYCGAVTIGALPNETICNVCEAYLSGQPAPDSAPPALSALNAKALQGDAAGLDAFALDLQKQGSVQTLSLYGPGVLYAMASGFAYRDLDYARPGFMEENAANVAVSMKLISKSKECFYKTLGTINATNDASGDAQLMYFAFMSNIFLNRPLRARSCLDNLNSTKKGGLAQGYCNMVYAVVARTGEVMQHTRPLLNTGEPNAFYYLARYLAQNKQFGEAVAVLTDLTNSLTMPMAAYLLKDLQSLLEKTRL